MYCFACGILIPDNTLHCQNCGSETAVLMGQQRSLLQQTVEQQNRNLQQAAAFQRDVHQALVRLAQFQQQAQQQVPRQTQQAPQPQAQAANAQSPAMQVAPQPMPQPQQAIAPAANPFLTQAEVEKVKEREALASLQANAPEGFKPGPNLVKPTESDGEPTAQEAGQPTFMKVVNAIADNAPDNRMKCPRCGSFNFSVPDNGRKALSVGKGIVGGMLLGPVGAAGRAAMGKKGKATFICHDCGHSWTQKLK